MAPKEIEEETYMIIQCLFQDLGAPSFLTAKCMVEPDGPEANDEDSFNPLEIAVKLRKLGDDYEETVIQPLINEMEKAAADQVFKVFNNSVESLCKMWVLQEGEVAPEKHLLKASIMLGLYAKKNCPNLTGRVQSALVSFINTRVAPWVFQQGGWDQVVSE